MHFLVVRVATLVSVLQKIMVDFYFFTFFLFLYLFFFLVCKDLCALHILLLILQDFKNHLPSQDFYISRIPLKN